MRDECRKRPTIRDKSQACREEELTDGLWRKERLIDTLKPVGGGGRGFAQTSTIVRTDTKRLEKKEQNIVEEGKRRVFA